MNDNVKRSRWQRVKDWLAGKWENSHFYKHWVIGTWDPEPRPRQWFLGWALVYASVIIISWVAGFLAGGISQSFSTPERIVYVDRPVPATISADLVSVDERNHWKGRAEVCEARSLSLPPLQVTAVDVPPAPKKPAPRPAKPKPRDPDSLDAALAFIGWPWFGN